MASSVLSLVINNYSTPITVMPKYLDLMSKYGITSSDKFIEKSGSLNTTRLYKDKDIKLSVRISKEPIFVKNITENTIIPYVSNPRVTIGDLHLLTFQTPILRHNK